MAHLKQHIDYAERDQKRFRNLAKKETKNKSVYLSIAKDEERNEGKLRKIEAKEAKTKALKKKTR